MSDAKNSEGGGEDLDFDIFSAPIPETLPRASWRSRSKAGVKGTVIMSDYSFRFFVIGVLQNLPETVECSAFTDGGLNADLGHDATFTLQWDDEDDALYRIWWMEEESRMSVCQVDYSGEELEAVTSWKAENLEDALSKLNGVMRNLTSGGESQEEMDHG